jgi:hypothetical protein
MAFDLSILSQDEAAITAELPATLVFGDQEVIGMSGPDMAGQRLTDEGFMDTRDIEFRALISRFKTGPATAPFNNQEFTHKETGKKYRIKTVQTDTPVNLSFVLMCVDITR